MEQDSSRRETLGTLRATLCHAGTLALLVGAVLIAVAHFHGPCPPGLQPPLGFSVGWLGWALLSLAGFLVALYSLRTMPLSPAAKVLLMGSALLLVAHYYRGLTFIPPELLPPPFRIYGWAIFNVIILLVVPMLLARPVLGQSLGEFGLRVGDAKTWGKHIAVYAAIMAPAIAVVSRWPDFRAAYPHIVLYGWEARDPLALGAWELCYVTYFFAWEFFFRGFLLHGTVGELGPLAIGVQMVPFVLTHFAKPEPEAFGAIVTGIALGTTSYVSRSFVGCWIIHCLCACGLDLLVVLWPVR